MTNKHPKHKIIVLLTQLGLLLVSLACSLTAGSLSTGELAAENSTHLQQTATTVGATKPTITATSTGSVCLITAGNLNLRAGPGIQYAIKASLPAGTTLSPLLSPSPDGWLQVKAGGQSGYVNSKFIHCERK